MIDLNKKLKIFLNYFLGPILFVWLSYSIYEQIQRQSDVQQSLDMILASFTGHQAWKLYLVIVLMLVHWSIESVKWQLLVKPIQKVSYLRAFRALFSGHAIAFNSINHIGESAGRVMYLEEGHRLKGIAISMVGSMSLIITTFVLGLCSMLYMRIFILDATHHLEGLSIFWLTGLMSVLTIGTALFTLLYFRLSWMVRLLEKIPFVAKYKFVVENMEALHWWFLTKILFLSIARYVVFVVQYLLLLQVFEVDVDALDAASLVSVMFLVLAIVPTIGLAELGFRGKVSIQLLGLLSSNTIGIIATAAGIWIINLLIPAIVGSVFLLGIRLFRNNK